MDKRENLMAYIAGLIDGDGSISIIRENRASGHKYHPCIQLSNVFKDMIELLYKTFGGCKKIKSPQKHAKKVQFVWNVRGLESCKAVIQAIMPYLILKKNQAKLLMEYIENPLDPETKHLKMKSLNNASLTADGKVVRQAKKNTKDNIFWAYFAGIMDTEGSFTIRKNKPASGGYHFQYCPMIQLSMASFEVMNFIRSKICYGNICFPKAKTTQRGFVFKMAMGSMSDCVGVINSLLPYLKFKSDCATELLSFCLNYTSVKHRQKGTPLEEIEFRESCYKRIKQLNLGEIYKPSLIDSEALKLGDEGQV